jgi:hypothetical protein
MSDQPVARPLPTQDNITQKDANIHALSGIRTHDPSNQPAKTHASDRTATVTGKIMEEAPVIQGNSTFSLKLLTFNKISTAGNQIHIHCWLVNCITTSPQPYFHGS